MGSMRCERRDLGEPMISSVRLPSRFSTLAVRCAVLLTVTVFFSQSISDHFSAHTSPSRMPVYKLSSAGKSFCCVAALRSLSCSERLNARCSAASLG